MPGIEALAERLSTYLGPEQVNLVRRAYFYAEQAHDGQRRRSGEPYVTHPLAVASILADMHMDHQSLMAAMLHDVIEDTGIAKEALSQQFGETVAELVDGVSKLTQMNFETKAEAQAENFQKMAMAMARDIRVILVKLADRLHNMRTLEVLSGEKRRRIAKETLEIYAPIANRLGMHTVRVEFEDLGFKAMHPMRSSLIHRAVKSARGNRKEIVAKIEHSLANCLAADGIEGEVSGRQKHLYGIYKKMRGKRRAFNEIMDVYAFRIVVDKVDTCYRVLGAVHNLYKPLPGRFKDYIAIPKANGYQSLHTTLFGMHGVPIEIQIRTREMEEMANNGIAAHWLYKSNDDEQPKGSHARARQWVKGILELQQRAGNSLEFIESVKIDLFPDEVYVFTPKGRIMELPKGSTAVDFAYAVHTEVGHHCIGARVNGRLVPLESTLENGDVVEVLTSKADGAGPSRDWLSFVKSPRARNKIKQWFSKERREESIEAGKESIAKTLRKQNLPLQRIMSHETMTAVANELRYQDIDALYAAVGEGHVSAQHVVHKVVESMGGVDGATEDLAEATVPNRAASRRRGGDPGVVVVGTADVWVKLAKCCTPVPGDPILGFVTRGNGVSVHRVDCTNASSLTANPERLIDVEWAPSSASVFLVQLQVEALDRSRLLSDVTRVLSDQHVNILSASVQTSRDRVALSRFTFEMGDPAHLEHVIKAVRKIDGVFDVYRVNGGKGTQQQR